MSPLDSRPTPEEFNIPVVGRIYLNGEMVDPREARVSVFDRGFVFGDGIYEVIPAFGGRAFRVSQHLDRLAASLAAVDLADPLTRVEWTGAFDRLLAQEHGVDQYIYLQVTRGVAPRDHSYPVNARPTVVAYAQRLVSVPDSVLEDGVDAVTADDIRWSRCDIKTVSLLANVVLRQYANERGAVEAILLRDGHVTEGAASNIFIVNEGVLLTPPKGRHILPGITRDLVLELAARHGLPHAEAQITDAALRGADEVWMTSSTKEIVPIRRVDGLRVGGGKARPVFARMLELYRRYKEDCRAGRAG
jgi:D-alanine transaminase